MCNLSATSLQVACTHKMYRSYIKHTLHKYVNLHNTSALLNNSLCIFFGASFLTVHTKYWAVFRKEKENLFIESVTSFTH